MTASAFAAVRDPQTAAAGSGGGMPGTFPKLLLEHARVRPQRQRAEEYEQGTAKDITPGQPGAAAVGRLRSQVRLVFGRAIGRDDFEILLAVGERAVARRLQAECGV